MAGMHVTGPLAVTGAISATTGLTTGTTVKATGTIASAAGINLNLFIGASTTSTLVIPGMAATDIVKSALKVRPVVNGVSVVSDLTSTAVPASGSCTFTAKPLTSAAVHVLWLDVSQAS